MLILLICVNLILSFIKNRVNIPQNLQNIRFTNKGKHLVCKDVFSILSPNSNLNSSRIKNAIQNIKNAKKNNQFLTQEDYKVISEEKISLIQHEAPFKGLGASQISFPYTSFKVLSFLSQI